MASFLTGLKLGDWLRLLRENAPAVDREHRARAAIITLAAASTSLLMKLEPEVQLDSELEKLWRRPLLILGLPRSGTTFLHQLLAANPAVVCPTRLECFNPWTFVTLQRLGVTRLLNWLPRQRRGIDQVEVGWSSPEEDEFALTALLADGPWIGKVFPRRTAEYKQRYPCNPAWDGASRWQDGLGYFTRKLVWLHRRPLVLKSPLHTGRIPELLSVFPEMRVVTVLRDPRDQWRSAMSARRHRFGRWPAVQNGHSSGDDPVEFNHAILKRYVLTRCQMIPGHLLEVTYEHLVADPLTVLRGIHEALELPGLEPTLTRLASETWWQSYRVNQHPQLTPQDCLAIRRCYRPLFEAGYYPDALDDLESHDRSRS